MVIISWIIVLAVLLFAWFLLFYFVSEIRDSNNIFVSFFGKILFVILVVVSIAVIVGLILSAFITVLGGL